ncbi:FAD-containing monooxygenase EthA [Tolypocladium paradoxum]|uniref:FAD-containing monooxygenase EthA n=1 Tax=Tolypocladium paradoxum TaxID=94208 RepID=A0A2S4KYL7_9HYPO|nr:FAD-containing monooxygenase EthA [Tolypocladium paradoxum]
MANKQDHPSSTGSLDFDVVIVGAGISGINAAYRIQTQAPPGTTYAIFEGRDSIGGTWDLFRYPGIRSDSDVFTFGFAWNPWSKRETLGMGPDIKEYMIQSAKSVGIDRHIRYRHKVTSANWIPEEKCWEVAAHNDREEKPGVYRSRFILLGTGYYDYEQPLETVIPGIDGFQGKVIHPQFWPEDYDYTGKSVVVIGSGATAVTIVPSVADKVKHVTMLQRSPTYIFPLPQHGKLTAFVFALLPRRMAQWLNRIIWILQGYLMVVVCRKFPGIAKRIIRRANIKHLPPDVAWDPHFKPRYNPWEQRLCASMDGDFFAAIRSGKASVVTDTIDTVTEDGIKLTSGAVLHPDAIVTATGLKLKFAGGIHFSINGEALDTTQRFAWRSCMLQGLPNLIFVVGYENASWTLGADCAAQLLTRLMWELRKKHVTVAMPHMDNPEEMEAKPMLSLSATYLKRMDKSFPKGGTGVWSPRSHYMADLYAAKWGDIKTGLLLK